MPEVPNLAQGAARAREQAQTATEAPEVLEATTAWVVFITRDGHTGSTPDLDIAITKDREPTAEEVAYGCLAVHDELAMQKAAVVTAQQTINATMQVQSQMRQQQEAAQVQASLANGAPAAFRKT